MLVGQNGEPWLRVWTGNGVNMSFDACGRFQAWYPSNLPIDLIVPMEKPDYCAPKGKADCRNYDFQGDRVPKFEAIWAFTSVEQR